MSYFYIVYYERIDIFRIVCCDGFINVIFECIVVVWSVFEVVYVCNVCVIYFYVCSFYDEVGDDVNIVFLGDIEVYFWEVVFVYIFSV